MNLDASCEEGESTSAATAEATQERKGTRRDCLYEWREVYEKKLTRALDTIALLPPALEPLAREFQDQSLAEWVSTPQLLLRLRDGMCRMIGLDLLASPITLASDSEHVRSLLSVLKREEKSESEGMRERKRHLSKTFTLCTLTRPKSKAEKCFWQQKKYALLVQSFYNWSRGSNRKLSNVEVHAEEKVG